MILASGRVGAKKKKEAKRKTSGEEDVQGWCME